MDEIEAERLRIQGELDRAKTPAERNRLGQFATPTTLAVDVLCYAISLLDPKEKIHFLDPAIGTGSFYSALLRVCPKDRIDEALGFEIDAHYSGPARNLWESHALTLRAEDFTQADPKPRFNLLICNPPYVRHHHLKGAEKSRLQARTLAASGIKLSGLGGLYCHFLGLSHPWMADDGIAGWLIPSEFMDVNYGRAVKHYLLQSVTLLHIHRFDPNDVQFADALVSSAVVWFKKSLPPKNHEVEFSFGGTLSKPRLKRMVPTTVLRREAKWTKFPVADLQQRPATAVLSDFFKIKRGLATGDNTYFILQKERIDSLQLPMEVFKPVLPSPRYLANDEVQSDSSGLPIVGRQLFLLDTKMKEEEIQSRHPALWKYLQEGKQGAMHERYLCAHRKPWYSQEDRPAAPIVCTYLGRGDKKNGRPFRFILNRSKATAANVYLMMYPTRILERALETKPDLIRDIWRVLNEISPERLLGEGRVYGGGLHKLEPKELANLSVPEISELLPPELRPMQQKEFGLAA
jgi:adenine-specific DNA-methyltransferase